VSETPSLAERGVCSHCGAERLGRYCWRCGAPAAGAAARTSQPAAVAQPAEAAAPVPLSERVRGFAPAAPAAAAALAAALAALAFPGLGLLIGLAAFVALARALRARSPGAAGDGMTA
jgi:hypothetical protein